MTFRISVIAMVVAGTALLGNTAQAATFPGTPPPSEQAGGNGAGRPVTVVNVYGDNNTIATDGSVTAVGKDTRLNANTGDVSSSGTLGIDSRNSKLNSGNSTKGGPRPVARARYASPPEDPDGRPPFPAPGPGNGQSTAISGYEDHSVNVSGEDQIAVYDDSNLFVNRNGRLNANTGDTDSSGLNAVDVSGSTVKSGDHTEDGENGDDDERRSNPRPEDEPAGRPPTPTAQTAAPVTQKGPVSSTVTDEGESNATGKNTLTIGADGYDNLGANVHGKRNIATYDDSNVVVGGTGDVNAEIGDSDTSGAAVMNIHNSNVQSGNST